jgi:TPP-dependent pyruvate/acetoin dehydrogenase alpha subunit
MLTVCAYEQELWDEMKETFPELTALEAPDDLLPAQQLEMFKTMMVIREFETAVADLWKRNVIYGLAHSYIGGEAIAVGTCTALREEDYITSTHRGHGHTIAKGGDVNKMMAELMGKADGYCRGKGGSMHIAAVDKGMLGATGIVGSGMPIAVGAALTSSVLKKNYVTVCFHGDGGTNQGIWHESINLAATWNLPVIFLCENNQWAISFRFDQASKNPNIADRAFGYGIPGVTVDGFNPFAIYNAVKEAAARARAGEGPTLLVAKYFRYVGHFVADDQSYRDMKQVEPWMRLDPVMRMECYLLDTETATEEQIDAAKGEARDIVERAIAYGKAAPEPTPDQLFKDLYAPENGDGGA